MQQTAHLKQIKVKCYSSGPAQDTIRAQQDHNSYTSKVPSKHLMQ